MLIDLTGLTIYKMKRIKEILTREREREGEEEGERERGREGERQTDRDNNFLNKRT